MSVDLRMPNINGATEKEQLYQIRSYLYQMIPQLQWALENINSSSNLEAIQSRTESASGGKKENKDENAISTFNSIKSLIIKSADIVYAYYEEIDNLLKLSGNYVASSDFGDYVSETNQTINATNNKISQNITKIEKIDKDLDGIADTIKKNKSFINYGEVGTTLDNTGLATETAMGIEIGDYVVLEDGTVSNTIEKYARFTGYGLELFGTTMDNPVAYIKQYKLYITDVEVTHSIYHGGFVETTRYDKSIVTKWVGGEQ